MRGISRRTFIVAALSAATMLPGGAQAGPAPDTGWIPGNAGVMWTGGLPVPPQPVGVNSLWLTRRIATSPLLGDVQLLGSFLHGLYTSVSGAAWVSLTPGCLLPEQAPAPVPQQAWAAGRTAAIAASGLHECGVEGVAFDPLLPSRTYVSTYRVGSITGGGATIEPGGIYVSDDAGVTWRRLFAGIRGNGLAVGRPGVIRSTIVAGAIQRTNGDVGDTPSGGSLIVSNDDGGTWRSVTLPPSGCAAGVETSQRITPSIAFNPADQRIVYAGTNAGLYISSDAGSTWRLARQACGGTWGLAPTRDGSSVYVGDYAGRIWRTDAAGSSFTMLATVGTGKVQSLVLDPVDERHLYAAGWSGGAGVFRIDVATGATRRLGEALLDAADRSLPPTIPRPFPLTPGPDGAAPSLFLAHPASRLSVSTVLRGVFWRPE